MPYSQSWYSSCPDRDAQSAVSIQGRERYIYSTHGRGTYGYIWISIDSLQVPGHAMPVTDTVVAKLHPISYGGLSGFPLSS